MRRNTNPWNLAAARGGVATTPLEALTYAETLFLGSDYRTDPNRLAPGMTRHIINGFPDGKSGVVGRGAFVGQLTTPLSGGRIWDMIAVTHSTLTTRVVLVQGGKLYWHQAGGTTATEIQIGGTTSFAFPSGGEHTRLVRHGRFVYGIEGGATGRLFRVDVSTTGTWQAELLQRIETPTSEERITINTSPSAAAQTKMYGIYHYRVRPMTSSSAAYPPTGSNARLGEAVVIPDVAEVPDPTPSTALVRGQYITGVQFSFTDPANTTGNTHYAIERLGGDLLGTEDWRVIAVVPRTTDDSYSVPAGGGTRGWIYNASIAAPERFFTDSMWDQDIVDKPTVVLGEAAPVGATDITVHSGRLWLAKDNTLYASWLLDHDPIATDYGLVWTTVPNPDASDFLTQGASFTIGGDGDSDTIVALSQAQADTAAGDYGGVLIAFRQNSHTFISGDTPADWSAEPSRVGEHYGCLSPKAIANVEGTWIYQSPRGPQILVTNSAPQYLGEQEGQFPLEPYLSQDAFPALVGATYSALEYRRISYLAHDRRLWVFTSSVTNNPGSTQGWVWAWSARTNGWSFLSGYGFTGGVVLSTQNDTGQLYLAGRDGQLYRYDSTTRLDRPHPAHPGNPYDLSLTSRNHGADGGAAMFVPARPVELRVDVTCETDSSYLDWDITPGDNPNNLSAANWTRLLPQGRSVVEVSAPKDVRGFSHTVSLKITKAGPNTRIYGYQLTCMEQGAKRV